MRGCVLAGLLLAFSSNASAEQDFSAEVTDWRSPGFEVTLERGSIDLRGHFATPGHRLSLLELAGSNSTLLRTSELKRHVVLPDFWQESSRTLISLVQQLHSGYARLSADQLLIRGAAGPDSEWAERFDAIRAGLPVGFEFVSDVELIETTSLGAICERLFATILKQDIRFPRASSEIPKSAYAMLNRLADIMGTCPGVTLGIAGHTDNLGQPSANRAISLRRAERVAHYLTDLGISPGRISTEGKGSAEPAGNNQTWAGRNLNRRVEIEAFIPRLDPQD